MFKESCASRVRFTIQQKDPLKKITRPAVLYIGSPLQKMISTTNTPYITLLKQQQQQIITYYRKVCREKYYILLLRNIRT